MPDSSQSEPRRDAPSMTELQNATGPDVPARPNGRLPVGTVAFLTSLYAVIYLVWEQSHWGGPAVRDFVGNVAFMPLNLGVFTLFALASRQEILDSGVR